jgi:hypothetical protein
MKAQKILLVLAALFFGGIGSAMADGHVHGSVGIYVGPGWGYYPRPYYRPYYPGPYLYPDPYYAPAPVVVVPSAPPVYIERNDAAVETAPAPDTNQYWYYCSGPNKYYPYVKECPGGWQKVLPQPGNR